MIPLLHGGPGSALGGPGGAGGDTIIRAPIHIVFHAGASLAKTNAAADTEFGVTYRAPYVLPAGVPCWGRMYSSGNANGFSTADIRYSKNGGSTFLALGVSVDITAQSGVTVFGSWALIPDDAKGDYIASPFVNGNGAADPAFSSLGLLITFEDPT